MTIHTTNSIQYNFNVLKQEEPVIRKAITKRGSKFLLWIMLGCARANIRTNKKSNITQFYTRLAKIKGSSKAAVAAS